MSYLVTLLTTTKGIGIDEGLEPLTENFWAWSKANRKVTYYYMSCRNLIAISFLSTTLLSKFLVLF